MNSIKCKACGLTNFASDLECRRCRTSFLAVTKPATQKPRRFSIWSLAMIALILGVGYYFYSGVQGKLEEVNANDAKRAQTQPAERPIVPGQSRNEYDRSKATHYGNLVANSQSIANHTKRGQDTEKAIQQASNMSGGK